MDIARLIVEYTDGSTVAFYPGATAPPQATLCARCEVDKLRIRQAPSIAGAIVDYLYEGDQIEVIDDATKANGIWWRQIASGQYQGAWVAEYDESENRFLAVPCSAETPPPTTEPPIEDDDTVEVTTIPAAGFNRRPFFFEDTDIYPVSDISKLRETFDRASEIGMQYVRAYACHGSLSMAQNVERVKWGLDFAQQYGIGVLVVLIDAVGYSGHILREDRQHGFYNNADGFINQTYWNAGNAGIYEFTELLMQAVGNHPALFGIQWGNELSPCYPNKAGSSLVWDAFKNCADKVHKIVRTYNKTCHYWPGILSIEHITPSGMTEQAAAIQFYDLGIWTARNFHLHQFEAQENPDPTTHPLWKHEQKIRAIDLDLVGSTHGHLPAVADEFGVNNQTNRNSDAFIFKVTELHGLGLSSVVPWGFDEGDDENATDRTTGLSRQFNPHNFVPIIQWLRDVWVPNLL